MTTLNRTGRVRHNHDINEPRSTGHSRSQRNAFFLSAALIAMVAFGLTYCGGNQAVSGDSPVAGPSGNASALAAAPASVSFGTVATGESATQMVTLSNTGQGVVTLSQASVTGSGFSISNLALPMTLQPGANTSFYAKFAPVTTGSSSGTIAVTSNASHSPLMLLLLARGATAQLGASPSSLSFGNVSVGSSSALTLTLTNTGVVSITISTLTVSGTGFTVSPENLPLSLAASQSVNLTVTYSPTASSTSTGVLSIWGNQTNSPLGIELTGSGQAVTGTLTANPTGLSFGNVTVGNDSTLPVVVTNSGSASVTITQASTSGSGFSVSGASMPLTLAAGQNTSFSVMFDPAAAGAVNGNLSLTSNASNSPTVTILSATGTIQHSVSLSWVASASASVTGYNVYRGTVSGGPYSKLTSSPVIGTSYKDSDVQPGQTYYYVTSAINSQGIESSDSNQATAVIPSP